jgi:hypothetical protein
MVKNTLELGLMTKEKDKVSKLGQMVKNMKVSGIMIKKQDKAY